MERIEQCIVTIQKQIESITKSFYQQNIQDGYQELICIIDNFTKLINMIKDNYTISKFEEVNNNFKSILDSMMEAMNKKDTVLIADILNYDISDVLTNIGNESGK